MKIYLAADHGGFIIKKQLFAYLERVGFQPIDCGNTQLDQNDDYPDFIRVLAGKMLVDPKAQGIVICRNGVGVSIAVNRYRHLRCGLGLNEQHVKSARADDNINVLALAADYFNFEQSQKLVDIFLHTQFSGLERHNRRLAKINDLTTVA